MLQSGTATHTDFADNLATNDGGDATATTQRRGIATWSILQWVTATWTMLQWVTKGPPHASEGDHNMDHVAMVTAIWHVLQ